MTRILVNLNDEELRAAQVIARREGISRSEAIRRSITAFAVPGSRAETAEARAARFDRNFERLRASGRKIKAMNPEWDPVALIRASRDGRIRL